MSESRRLVAIMFTDTVGYSASVQVDEAGTLARLQEQEGLLRTAFREFRGREIKSTGDGFLVEFASALQAAQCAIEIQRRMRERNLRPGAVRMDLRIGIHLGDVERRARDIFGDAVNIAARVEPFASPGGVCVSQQIYDQVSHKLSTPFESLGTRKLKGIEDPLRVYRLVLPWEVAPPTGPRPERLRLAVLPLANISPDPHDEYLADGLTEELIATLSRIHPLRVIARTSVNQYRATTKSLTQIGAELDIGSVIEGSVRKAGNRLRITLQLIDVPTQEHIWAETFDRQMDDVFAVQAEVAEKTARALRLEFGGREPQRIRPTNNLAAYNLYLQGIHSARLTTHEGDRASARYLEEAIREDPNFAVAHAFLANSLILMAGAELRPQEVFPRARELTARALALDPDAALAHTALGNLRLQADQDWAGAEEEFLRAIQLNPSDVDARFWYAMLLLAVKRFPQAVEELRTVLELDPLWRLPREWLVFVHIAAGELEDALAFLDENTAQSSDQAYGHAFRAMIYFLQEKTASARREVELIAESPRQVDQIAKAGLRAWLGEPSDARRLIDQLVQGAKTSYVPPVVMAHLHAFLKDREQVYEWLDRDFRDGGRTFWSEYQAPQFSFLREEPRFQALLAQLHLPQRD